ncbi:MAG TPA: SDR family oxidoreductase [Burkholderiales bacterium]|nr:SDR family oxidoreductase [Burkholderiales bacterium]
MSSGRATGRLLITGASSQIGAAVARALAPDYRLVLGGRDAASLERTRAGCADPGAHAIWRFDLDRVEQIAGALAPLVRSDGIEALVYIAGIARPTALSAASAPQVARVFSVNVLAALELIRLLSMRRYNSTPLARVVLMSSVAVRRPVRGFAAYCASKGALESLARALSVELSASASVAALAAPAVDVSRSSDAAATAIQAAHVGRKSEWITPEEVAWAVRRLLAGEEGPLRGETFSLAREAADRLVLRREAAP